MRRRLTLLTTYLAPHLGKTSIMAVLIFINIGLTLVIPQWLGRFIDEVQAGGSLSALVAIAVTFIWLTVANQIVVPVAGYLAEDVSWRTTNALRRDLTDHCLDLDMSFHKRHTPGELIERVDGDVATLGQFFSSFVFHVAGNVLLAAGIIAVSFTADWRVGLVLLVFSIVALPVLRRTQGVVAPYFRDLRQTEADISGFLEERLSATEDIRANGSEAYVRGRLAALLRTLSTRMRRESVASRASSSVLEISVAMATGGVLTMGALLLPSGTITLGGIYVGYYYASQLSLALFRVTYRVDALQIALVGMDRIAELFAERTKVADHGLTPLPPGALSIVFDEVGFEYVPGNKTLDGVSFEVPAGEATGLLGRTGSGKTTVSRLLYRGHDVAAGAIRLSGTDVRDVPLAELRHRIGVVTQDVQLFHATVRDNLTMFDPEITDERIGGALAALGISDWCEGLPDGLDTELAGGADSLSAGEAQLLALARLFLRDPDVVILDEASSRLDPGTERLVESAVRKLLEGRTAIVIAHHLATVCGLDHIIVLDAGKIQESGRRAELADDPGSRFSTLLAEVPA